ncbi:hypothetical protein PoB_006661300 [Plakobranchus ocellatus]|uniref:Uncharacterized protein n=1 Tax=Plakobranchus ocellatus TaxID=259542 RepID=A0AAV4D7B5_9GAST|nr:hypothetical protein PoB_006661300 [Plakobranchus ocellatus]
MEKPVSRDDNSSRNTSDRSAATGSAVPGSVVTGTAVSGTAVTGSAVIGSIGAQQQLKKSTLIKYKMQPCARYIWTIAEQ